MLVGEPGPFEEEDVGEEAPTRLRLFAAATTSQERRRPNPSPSPSPNPNPNPNPYPYPYPYPSLTQTLTGARGGLRGGAERTAGSHPPTAARVPDRAGRGEHGRLTLTLTRTLTLTLTQNRARARARARTRARTRTRRTPWWACCNRARRDASAAVRSAWRHCSSTRGSMASTGRPSSQVECRRPSYPHASRLRT